MVRKVILAFIGACIVSALLVLCLGIDHPERTGQNTPTPTPTAAEAAFSEIEIVRVGKHTYYPNTLFDVRYLEEGEKEGALEFMKKADRNLTCDVFVNWYNSYSTAGVRLQGMLMEQGVVKQELSLSTSILSDGTVLWDSPLHGLEDKLSEIPIDLTGVRPAKDFFQTVYELAEEHKSAMFALRDEEPIRGVYMLKAKQTGVIYYEFRINEFSYVEVNAKTGDIIHHSFWNGVYE